jgi:hypothetical protein
LTCLTTKSNKPFKNGTNAMEMGGSILVPPKPPVLGGLGLGWRPWCAALGPKEGIEKRETKTKQPFVFRLRLNAKEIAAGAATSSRR